MCCCVYLSKSVARADTLINGMQIKGGPLLQKQLVHNATIASIVPRWQTFEASQFELQVNHSVNCCCAAQTEQWIAMC